MIDLRACRGGVVLPIRARPSAKTSAVRGVHDGALKVSVTQAPEKGKANKAIRRLLGSALGLKTSQLQIISGETSSQKEVLVADVSLASLRARLAPFLAAGE